MIIFQSLKKNDRNRKVGAEWNAMSPTQKKPYEARAELEKQRYEQVSDTALACIIS